MTQKMKILSTADGVRTADDGVEIFGSPDCDLLVDDVETGSSTSEQRDTADDTQEGEKLNLAKEETTAVFRLRLLVFLVLLLAAVTVSVIIFQVTTSGESNAYHSQYDAASKKVLESFIDIVDTKLAAVSAMGVAIIAHGVVRSCTCGCVIVIMADLCITPALPSHRLSSLPVPIFHLVLSSGS
jgi:uncharacterized membrane protein